MKSKLLAVAILVCLLAVVLTACGSVNITLNFDSNGGTAVESVTFGADSTITLPKDPTKDGYVFAGWYWDNDSFNEEFTAGSLLTTQIKENLTVYAKWISQEEAEADYTVKFNTKGGTEVTSITLDYGTVLTEPTEPTKAGFYFGGWYRDEACINAWIVGYDKVTKDTLLYAKWIEGDPADRTYTVVFFSNDEEIKRYKDVAYGSTVTEAVAPERVGYVFKGWYRSEAYENRWFFEEDQVKSTTLLYAKWVIEAESTYTVVFNTNGGSALASYYEVLFNSTIEPPENSIKKGYAVAGWYKDNTFAEAWSFEIDRVRTDITLYAKWELADTSACAITVAEGFELNGTELFIKVPNTQGTFSFFDKLPSALLPIGKCSTTCKARTKSPAAQ